MENKCFLIVFCSELVEEPSSSALCRTTFVPSWKPLVKVNEKEKIGDLDVPRLPASEFGKSSLLDRAEVVTMSTLEWSKQSADCSYPPCHHEADFRDNGNGRTGNNESDQLASYLHVVRARCP